MKDKIHLGKVNIKLTKSTVLCSYGFEVFMPSQTVELEECFMQHFLISSSTSVQREGW